MPTVNAGYPNVTSRNNYVHGKANSGVLDHNHGQSVHHNVSNTQPYTNNSNQNHILLY